VSARLLLVASLNFADDYGGLDRSAKQLKAQAFPYDQIDCEPLIQELIRVGMLIQYEVNNRMYLHIKGFQKHQKVEKPAKPRIPVYDPSVNTPLLLPESSPSPHLLVAVSSSEGNGREGKGVKRESTRGRGDERATRLSENWEPTDEFWEIAKAEGIDPERTAAKFRDYWISVPGAKGRKLNWKATWRNWCRSDAERNHGRSLNGSGGDDEAEKIWSQLIASDGSDPPRTEQIQSAINAVGGWPAIRLRTPYEDLKLKNSFCDALRGTKP